MKRPLNIIHLLQWFELGGGESLALRLAQRQQAAGHGVIVVGLAGGPLADELQSSGISVALVEKGQGFDGLLYTRLARFFLAHRPDVVHTHDQQSLVYSAAPARLCGATVVHTKHGATVESRRRLALRRLAARCVHAFVAVSESTAATARQYREVDDSKLSVIPNGVDLAQFRADVERRQIVRDELGIPQHARVIATVGRHAEEKNPLLLLRAAAPLLDERTHLCFVGAGSLTDELEQRRSRLPDGAYVHLLGARRDVARLLAAFDVFALSSRTEGLPLVLLEAMATELSIVSTAVGGIPGMVEHGKSGLLVAPGEERELREALELLLSQPQRARAMGRLAREVVAKRYGFDQMAAAYERLYWRA